MDKREKEMRTVYEMIHLYCRKIHREKELCPECLGLYEYAKMRIKKCKREQIRKVMRFSGPRMLVYHPVMAICHLYYQIKDK